MLVHETISHSLVTISDNRIDLGFYLVFGCIYDTTQ